MNHIILHRHKGKPWRFDWDDEKFGYIHVSKHGTIYKIIFVMDQENVVWIGKRNKNEVNSIGWWQSEKEIRADYFDLGRVRITFKGSGDEKNNR